MNRPTSPLPRALAAVVVVAAVLMCQVAAWAASPIAFVVLRENGVGTSRQAQPHLDRLLAIAAKKNGWPGAEGKYLTRRSQAEQYIKEHEPDFGILSLGAFLALNEEHGLRVIGEVDSTSGGGRRYFLVSKKKKSLAQCEGSRLASDHLGDRKFIDGVVSGGDFKLSDFKLVETRRPVQTLKKVIRDDAECALIDDAQLESLPHVSGGSELKTVWKSRTLPGMAVVAFGGAPADRVEQFKASLPALCKGEGAKVCESVGIRAIEPATKATYAKALAAYGK